MSLSRYLLLLTVLLSSACSGRYCWAQECDSTGRCDTHERCSVWKEEGECIRNREYMEKYCAVSCSDAPTKKDITQQTKDCKDIHARCPVWAELGECASNPEMLKYCAFSCDSCSEVGDDIDGELCVDDHEKCSFWASSGECTNNPNWMLKNCAKSCNSCVDAKPPSKQKSQVGRSLSSSGKTLEEILELSDEFGERQKATGNEAPQTLDIVEATIEYMKTDDYKSLPENVRDTCLNRHELCSFWAHIGECKNNEAYMVTNCAPACKSCHLIDFANRCPPLEDAEPALQPGRLNTIMEHIVETAPGNSTLFDHDRERLEKLNMTEFSAVVYSRPGDGPSIDVSLVDDKSKPPWVITLENFLTDDECDALIQLGYKYGYKRSEDVGPVKFDGSHDSQQSKGRTSENAWCSSRQGCRQEEIPNRIHERIAEVLTIPAVNSEDLQILKYEVGQFYNTHHDYIPHQRSRQCGPRVLTFFLYLSDVEVGGGTDFPDLGITVMPKKGRALLWPSVYSSKPFDSDNRMRHQALPVEAGTKFAANGWIHMYDYVTPQEKGCN